MAAPTQPDNIPRPWASGTNNYHRIDDTTDTAGAASWSEGFPESCTKPLNQGGTLPHWLDMQGVLNALSSHIVYLQSGGQYAWSGTADYAQGAIVNKNGTLYIALQASTNKEPGTSGGAAYWSPVVTSSDLVTDLAGYLLKSGGTMTGALAFASGIGITTAGGARLKVNSKDVAYIEDIPSTPTITVNTGNGYARIGGMQIAWGTATSQTTKNFPVAFSAVPVVVASMSGGRNPACVTSITTSNFYVDNANLNDSDGDNTTTLYWIAIGTWSAS